MLKFTIFLRGAKLCWSLYSNICSGGPIMQRNRKWVKNQRKIKKVFKWRLKVASTTNQGRASLWDPSQKNCFPQANQNYYQSISKNQQQTDKHSITNHIKQDLKTTIDFGIMSEHLTSLLLREIREHTRRSGAIFLQTPKNTLQVWIARQSLQIKGALP